MGLKLYLFSLYSALLISIGLFIILLTNVNPYTAPVWILVLFYFILFIIIFSTFGIITFYLKVWFSNREVIYRHIGPTLRQAGIIAFAVVALLFLEHIKVLNWWIVCLFIAALALIELFFRSKK